MIKISNIRILVSIIFFTLLAYTALNSTDNILVSIVILAVAFFLVIDNIKYLLKTNRIKKWKDINKKRLLIASILLVIGFIFNGIISDLLTERSLINFILKGLATAPFLIALIEFWEVIKKTND